MNSFSLSICSVVTVGEVTYTYRITFINWGGVSVIFHRKVIRFDYFVELVCNEARLSFTIGKNSALL